jgi:hypothetical protein
MELYCFRLQNTKIIRKHIVCIYKTRRLFGGVLFLYTNHKNCLEQHRFRIQNEIIILKHIVCVYKTKKLSGEEG